VARGRRTDRPSPRDRATGSLSAVCGAVPRCRVVVPEGCRIGHPVIAEEYMGTDRRPSTRPTGFDAGRHLDRL